MKYKKFLILLLSFVILPNTSAFSDDQGINSGIVYGKDHSYTIQTPLGWVLDNHSGKDQGLYAVFYPKGGSWSHSLSVMYTRATSKKLKGAIGFNDVIQADITDFRKDSPKLKVESLASVKISEAKEAVVKKFVGAATKNVEAVAYIDEEKVVPLFVLSSRNEEEFQKALSPFRELVASYKFLTQKVIIKGRFEN